MLHVLRSLILAAVVMLAACSVNTNDVNPEDGFIDIYVDDVASECYGMFVEITIIQGGLVVGPYSATVDNGRINCRAYEGNVGGQHSDADLNPNLPIEVEIRIVMISKDCETLIEQHLGKDITAGAGGTVLTSGYITGSGGVWSRDFSNFTVDSNPH